MESMDSKVNKSIKYKINNRFIDATEIPINSINYEPSSNMAIQLFIFKRKIENSKQKLARIFPSGTSE
jgi:hypothetical protein